MDGDEDCNIRVICRFRPVNKREIAEGGGLAKQLSFPTDKCVEVAPWNGRAAQTFNFDKVFYDPSTTQEDIYELSAKKSIEDVIRGYNATIFAYGQTGAGKSFTMFGPDIETADLKGIIPRSCMHIFQHIASDTEGTEYTIKCSFLEIYKENVRDLLNPHTDSKGLRIREAPGKGVWVEGLHEAYVTCEEDVIELIRTGERQRATSSTNMNATSSRSHSLFILTLHQKTRDGSTKEGRLNLADLAGSEKVGKTGATGDTLEEAKKINQSLSALGNCINALTKSKKAHVPYRDSKLTFILRESLGGNCKTTLLVACSPHIFNLEETISTLLFAKRAKTIKNSVKVNKQRSVAELMAIIEKLKKELTYFKKYVTILEQELEKIKGPNWKDDLPKIARAAPSSDKSKSDSTSDSTPDSQSQNENENENENDQSPSKPTNSTSSDDQDDQSPSRSTKHHRRTSSVQGVNVDEEDDKVFSSSANMSVKLAELQVEIQQLKEKTSLEINDLTEEKKSLTEDVSRLEKKISDKKTVIKEREATIKQLRDELDSQHQAKALVEEKFSYEIKQLSLKNEQQQETLTTLTSHNSELKQKTQTLTDETEQLLTDKERLQTDKDRLQREFDELSNAVQRKETRITELETNLSDYEKEYSSIRNQHMQLELQNKNLLSKLESTTNKFETLTQHSKDIESQLRQANHEKQSLENQISQLQLDISSLESELEETKEELFNVQKAFKEAENEQIEELRTSTVPLSQFERLSKEREKLRGSLNQTKTLLQEERDLVATLKKQLTESKLSYTEQIDSLKQENERKEEEMKSQIQLLEAQLADEHDVNTKRIRTLEEKSTSLNSQYESEKQARLRAEQALQEQSEILSNKEKLLRRANDSLEDKDREIARQNSLVQSQTRSLTAQEERITCLENELEEVRRERELLQQEIKTALEINIENAKQFENQLEMVKQESQRRPQNIRVPVQNERGIFASIFGIKQYPLLGEITDPVKYGYLLKRSNWLKVWEKRWFVVTKQKIMYYFENNNQASKAAGQIELEGCKVAPAAEFTGKPHTFGVLHRSRKEFYFQAASEDDSMDWMRNIHAIIQGKVLKQKRNNAIRATQSEANVHIKP